MNATKSRIERVAKSIREKLVTLKHADAVSVAAHIWIAMMLALRVNKTDAFTTLGLHWDHMAQAVQEREGLS